MAETRSKRNAVKIEGWRLSRVNSGAEDIYQGDMVMWAVLLGKAQPAVAASGASFIGVSDTSTVVPSLGVLTSDQQLSRINVIQSGLVEMIAGEGATIKPFDPVYIGADAQTIAFSGSNAIGYVDPGFVGGASKAVSLGDFVRIWITVQAGYKSL